MEVFLKDISFHGILFHTLFNHLKEEKLKLQHLVQQGIDSGVIKPLVHKVFENDEIEQAFRYIAASKHIGKVLIKIRSEEEKRFVKPLPINIMAYPRIAFDNKSSCIICGNYYKKYVFKKVR